MDSKNWLSPFRNDFLGDRFFNNLIPKSFNDFFKADYFGPSVDLKETDNEIILRADIPGVNPEDLDITVDENTIILKGEIKQDQDRNEKGYHITERRYGSFYRTLPLPVAVKSDQSIARYKNGVLELRVPKAEPTVQRGFKPKIQSDDRTLQ